MDAAKKGHFGQRIRSRGILHSQPVDHDTIKVVIPRRNQLTCAVMLELVLWQSRQASNQLGIHTLL